MKKGEHYLGKVERVDFPNKGIVKIDDITCVIKNVLPGAEIEFVITKKHSGKAEGRLVNVMKPSALECQPPCPHFGVCGGCTYINMPYQKQCALKGDQVLRLLTPVLERQQEEWEFIGVKESPKPYEYRNKMEFSFGDEYKNGPLSLGMHKRGSFHDVVTVSECQIVDEDYRKILNITRDYFEGIPFYHKLTHTGFLRHLLVRKAAKTGEILIALVTTSKEPAELNKNGKSIEEWKDKILGLELTDGLMTGILHIQNDSVSDVVKSDKTICLYGREYINEELLGLKFKISTFSFFQPNSRGAEVLYSTVRDFIGDLGQGEATVFDLYSGTGTISQLMAPVAKKVIGVEIVEEAVQAAKENAIENGLHNCEFIADDVLLALDRIEDKPDFIILDPPRDGVHPKALKKIIDYGVERLIYVSCKPTSLARDLEAFLLAGYHVEKFVCVDQFSWTANIETVCLLSNRKADSYVNIGVDVEDYYKIKSEE